MFENESSFYMTLPSNVKDIFGSNKIGNYKTKHAQVYRLDSLWEVALFEIHYTKSWFNIKTPQLIAVEDTMGNVVSSSKIVLKPGGYDNQANLIEIINNRIEEATLLYFERLKLKKSDISFALIKDDKFSRRIILKAGSSGYFKPIFPILGKELKSMFGLDVKKYSKYNIVDVKEETEVNIAQGFIKGDIEAFQTYDLTAGIHSLYVNCDIVKPSPVGNTYSKLLRVVQVPSSKFGEKLYKVFDQPHYHRLITNEFQTIEIDIKDDSGETINFNYGRVTVKLHFRHNEL